MANALVTLVDQQVVVQVFGAALLDDMVQRAEDAADRAEIAAGVAVSGLNHEIYDDLATAEGAVAEDDYFILDTGNGTFQYRQNTSPDSTVLFTYIGQPMGYTSATVNGELVSVPYYRAVTDLFIIVGQSNAEGRGTSASSPDSSVNFEVDGSSIISLVDPVGGATTGSMWPAWGLAHNERTGHRAAFVECATGGTALIAAADTGSGNWSASGALRAAAVAAAQDAIDAIELSGDHLIGNIYFVWVQGEADAQALAAATGGVSGANYQTELETLADYFQAQIPRARRMFIVRLGHRNNRAEAAAWWDIRDAQEAAANGSTFMQIVYRGATSFPADAMALHMPADQLHWNQTALNLVGTAGAYEAAAANPTEPPTPPAILSSSSYIDTDTTTATSRTDSHTTHADTKALVVGVASIRVNTSVTLTPSSVTYNGVAMTLITPALGGTTGVANTTSVGRTASTWWMLTETDYGDTLGGVTANLVVTMPGTSASLITNFAYNLDLEPLVEAAPYAQKLDPNEGTVYTAGFAGALADGLSTGAPTLAIGLMSSTGDGAAALTHTWAGLTEDYDGGGSTGTRSGQASSAHGTFATEVLQQAITCTSSAMTGGALIVLALRGRVAGEEDA